MGEKGCELSIWIFIVFIKVLCDEGLVEKGFILFDEMRIKGCKVNVYIYMVLIDGLCRDGKVEEVNGVY